MVVEKNTFIIDYDESLSYVPEVVSYLESNVDNLMDFFELNSLKYKRKIVFYNDLEKYKEHIEKYYKYRDYMCADTNDGNINILSLEEAHKTKEHANMTLDETKRVILHEFVHICQQDSQIDGPSQSIGWFWEALATNLGNPENFSTTVITATDEQISNFNSLENNYNIAFTIGKYMLNNYSHDEILEYVKHPAKLQNDSSNILSSAREWSKNNNKKI